MLSLSYIYQTFISWQQRRQAIAQMSHQMFEMSHRVSAFLCRTLHGSVGENFIRDTLNISRAGRVKYKSVPLSEANGFQLYEISPQVSISLDDWSVSVPTLPDYLHNWKVPYAVLELTDINNIDASTLNGKSVQLNDIVTPVASKCDSRTKLLVTSKWMEELSNWLPGKSSSLQRFNEEAGLEKLVHLLLDDYRIMDGSKEIHINSVMCVELHNNAFSEFPGYASNHVPTSALSSNHTCEQAVKPSTRCKAETFQSTSVLSKESDPLKNYTNEITIASDSIDSNNLKEFDSSLGGEAPADRLYDSKDLNSSLESESVTNMPCDSNGVKDFDSGVGVEASADFDSCLRGGAPSDTPNDGLQDAVTPRGKRVIVSGKPPNILIYCGKVDSRRLFEGLRQTFAQCLNPNRYTVYHLKHEAVGKTPWADNTALLIVASEKVYDGVDKAFVEYFLRGGLLVSFTSVLDSLFINRTDNFTSSKIPGASKPTMSLISYADWDNVTAICGRYRYEAQGGSLIKDVTVTQLATDAKTKNAVIVEMSHEESGGIAILSQVNLEKDPSEMAISKEIFAALKRDNSVRFDVLRHLLSSLGLDCDRPSESAALTPIYLLTENQSQREAFLASVRPRLRNGGQLISSGHTTLIFDADTNQSISTEAVPIITDARLSDSVTSVFNHTAYRKNLKTRVLGNAVMFVDVTSTTMTLLGGLMYSLSRDIGLIAIARRQTQGQGRRENLWLSPLGCASFSLHVRVALDSNLGCRVSFLQHMVALAVVLAVRAKPGYEMLDMRIKWPNDIYFSSAAKLGGVLVRSSILSDTIHANIGCGINVMNRDPTVCVNDLIRQHNNSLESDGQGDRLEMFTVEEMIARTVTQLERLIDMFQSEGCDPVSDLYYKYWLHSGVEVEVGSKAGQTGRVLGLDDFGYLRVLMQDGSTVTLQPDDNSFDMMRNLVVHKS